MSVQPRSGGSLTPAVWQRVRDGIGPDGVLPALLIAAGGAYALAPAFLSVLIVMRRELTDDTPAPG